MAIELKRDEINLLINLLTQQMDRVGAAKEQYGFYNSSYFYRLVDIRNKLLAVPVAKRTPVHFSLKQWEKYFERQKN